MKIGVVSLALHTNYGGILQAYALQTVLKRMGHEAVLIDRTDWPRPWSWRVPLGMVRRAVRKYVLGAKCCVTPRAERARQARFFRQYTNRFIEAHIDRQVISDIRDVQPTDYQCLLVGSDQVWRAKYFREISENGLKDAFFYFARDWGVKRYAYAASFGTDEWEFTAQETAECGALTRQMDGVSVREASAVGLCKEYFGVDAVHVLDPTMLLTADDYRQLFDASAASANAGKVMTYVLDHSAEKDMLIKAVAEKEGKGVFETNKLVVGEAHHEPQPPVEDWLRAFHDASYVVTDSFHACVFSILFEKQFVVYGNSGRGLARFQSLLSMLGLEDRLVSSAADYAVLPPIDYAQVNARLAALRERSLDFLKQIPQ